MSDVLIRDIPDDVLASLDAIAARLGLSRTEYIRRRLAQDAQTVDKSALVRLTDSPAMPVEYLTPRIEDRALEVQTLLADRGHHRGPSIPDLLIAATAELSGLTVLHVDKDFDAIAALTGQKTERLTHRPPSA